MNLLKPPSLRAFTALIRRYRGLIFRIIFCWLLGVILLTSDLGRKNFDYRFQARGPQNFDKDIVILQISQHSWDSLLQPSYLKSMIYRGQPVSDNYYWSNVFWLKFLEALDKLQPKAVGVSFFFNNNIVTNWKLERYFTNSPVTWIAETDTTGRILTPKFTDTFNENIGINFLPLDADQVVRQFIDSPYSIPHFAKLIAQRADITQPPRKISEVINFRGASGTYKTYSISDVINNNIPVHLLKNKILLVGPEEGKEHIVSTPLGKMSRLELYANILDNIKNQLWIKHFSFSFYCLIILFLIIITTIFILNFPQAIAITLLFSFTFFYFAFSVFLFDVFYIWTPIFSAVAVIFLTYIIVISQMILDKEQNMWRLQKEQENLNEMEQLKTNFVSLISHDLKTPLAKIQSVTHRALSSLPQEDKSFDPLKEELNSIYKESKNLDRYIKSILQLSKVESKDFLVQKTPVDVNELIESACEQLSPIANERKIEIEKNLEPLFLIEADKILLREIIVNIIENAIKYTYDETKIKVESYEDEAKKLVVIKIKDDGPGIKKEHLDQVFKKFFRSDSSKQSQGSGLGLFLVKYFLDLHKGDIKIDSEEGHGTLVTMTIPIGVD